MAHDTNDQKKSYKDTLNLPRTDLPIRADAKQDDPALLERWQKENLYQKSFECNKGNEKYILHDGPPYANGPIHLGHAYNKILKDIITKSERMSGKQVPITPGWDCHGLPIELKVSQQHPGLSPEELKKKCREYAAHWVDVQREEFKKLGVLMNWDHPYLTMDYWYEAKILKAFGQFVEQGYIEKKKKTVPWCPSDQTVLATAEIEYKERKDPSIYVEFPVEAESLKTVVPELSGKTVSFLVWTTTPWTLPLNRAVLAKPKAIYDIIQHNDHYYVVASTLSEHVAALQGFVKNVVTQLTGEQLSTLKLHHPFVEQLVVPVILDHMVSLEDGTGLVHCAPGCGPQDYDVAIKNNLEIFSPISPDGSYEAGIAPAELEGMPVVDGQIWVLKKLNELGKIFFKHSIRHSYPHCWRCHNGLIFRATNQWFCNITKHTLKERALEAIEQTTFYPERSSNFLKATVEGRVEWCISRQRVWGVPIPALLCDGCGHAYISQELIETVAKGVQKEGIEFWDRVPVEQVIPHGVTCASCGKKEFIKEHDILDVWFDSGVSHFAVLFDNPELAYPANLYAEGVDQHRGWFQSSLLTSMVIEKNPCTDAFLTHGFTVDNKGHKMSKSLGNVVSPQEIIDTLGTDGLRLWVSSINYAGDAVVSDTLTRNIAQVNRKIRNTCRFLLSNLYDFNHKKDAVALEHLLAIDRYALEYLSDFNSKIQEKYARKDITGVYHDLADFCAVFLSAYYLDIIKDRLYVEQANGNKRRSAQTAVWHILDTLTKLIAPILSFTAELVSDQYQGDKQESIHLQSFNRLSSLVNDDVKKGKGRWQLLDSLRSAILKELEKQREKEVIRHSLDAQVTLSFNLSGSEQKMLDDFFASLKTSGQTAVEFLQEFLIVSQVTLADTADGLGKTTHEGLFATVAPAAGNKCPRCWNWSVTDHADKLCARCAEVVD